jgi:hypothetical protein
VAKKKLKTSKELAKSIAKFLQGKETNKDNEERFNRAVRQTVKRGSK